MIKTFENKISIEWWVDDIKSMVGYEDMTDDECRQTLQLALENHDATIGINWDVLQYHADQVKKNRQPIE